MARGINKVILVGNLGADPEMRHTGGGTAVTTHQHRHLGIWTDKQTGEKQEDRMAPRETVRPAGRDRRRLSEEGPPGLRRRLAAHRQVHRQTGHRTLQHRHHRQRDADARRQRGRRWRRWWRWWQRERPQAAVAVSVREAASRAAATTTAASSARRQHRQTTALRMTRFRSRPRRHSAPCIAESPPCAGFLC